MIGLLCFALAVLTSPFKSRLVDPSEIPKLLSERRDLCLPIADGPQRRGRQGAGGETSLEVRQTTARCDRAWLADAIARRMSARRRGGAILLASGAGTASSVPAGLSALEAQRRRASGGPARPSF
jgi:hypothetical protein